MSPKRRQPLSRDRVLRAAVALADKKGAESLSMRNLAKELGVEAMSLYNHVANKDDLLDGMVDLVFSEIDIPPYDGDWKAVMRTRANSTRDALNRHRWANGLMESRAKLGLDSIRVHNAVLGYLREAGFSIELTVQAYSVLDAYIYGFALQEMTIPFEDADEAAAVARAQIERQDPAELLAQFPYIAEVVGGHVAETGYDFDESWAFGLELILDRIDALPRENISR